MKPETEYCVLMIQHWATCMTKAEWASWVQAIGSIVAILGSVALAMWLDRRSLRARRTLAIRKARTFAAQLSAVADLVIEKVSPSNDLQLYRLALAMADEALVEGRSIEQELLALEWTAAVISLRSIGAQITEFLRCVTPTHLGGNYQMHVSVLFREYQEKIDTYISTVKQAHPGLRVAHL